MTEFWQAVINNINGFWAGIGGGLVATLLSWFVKAWIERKKYVSKVRFDAEFAIYRDLFGAFLAMVRLQNNLFVLMERAPRDPDERKDHYAKN